MKSNINLGLNLLSYYLFKRKSLLSTNLIITYKCNFNCSYCNVNKINKKELSTPEIKKLIDESSALGSIKFGFTGGEPLLRQDLFELIEYAKSKGMKTHVVTNGFLIKRYLDKLKKLDTLFVSLDGSEEINKKQRNKFDVLDAITTAVNNNVKVCILTTLTRDNSNLENIKYLLDKSKQLNIPIMFQPLIKFDFSPENISNMYIDDNDLKKIADFLIKNKKKYKIANSKSYLKFLLNPKLKKCYASYLYCIIDSNGDVYPCYPAIGNYKPINAVELGLDKAFKKLKEYKCNGCNFNCHLELNYLLSLHPNAIVNLIKHHV